MASSHVDARLLIAHFADFYEPITCDEIVLTQERKGTPSKLEFTVVNDNVKDVNEKQGDYFCEGNSVRLMVDNRVIWYGRIFTKKRDKQQHIKVTAYDGMFYLKKETVNGVNENWTASQIIRNIFENTPFYQNSNIGTFDDTKYRIPSVVFSYIPMLDAIQQVLDTTVEATQRIYTLFDDAGNVYLKELGNMKLDYLLTNEVFEDFDYNSTIADSTYNAICLYRKENDTITEKVVYTDDNFNIKNKNTYEGYDIFYRDSIRAWGQLAHNEEVKSTEVNLREKALAMLRTHNQKFKTLTVKECFGRIDIRAGCLIPVHLDLGDLTLNNKMMIENVKHKFRHGHHSMDMQLVGNEFVSSTVESAGRAQAENKTLDIRFNGGSSNSSGVDWGHGITVSMLNSVFKGELSGMGEIFLKHSNAYKVNPALMAAISIHETGNGTSSLCKNKKNFFGMKGKSYSSKEDGIKAGISNLSKNYIFTGRKTLESIRNKYAPLYDSSLNSHWIPGVSKYYKQIAGKEYTASLSGTGVKSDSDAVYYTSSNNPTGPNNNASMSSKVKQLINIAKTKIGCAYVWGAKGPNSFDCSGFIYWIFKQIGVSAPAPVSNQEKLGKNISYENMQPGDIIAYRSSSSPSGRHIVLYIGDGNIIHAKGKKYGVVKESITKRDKNKVISVRRLI